MHISTVRWVSSCYGFSVTPSLWGLQLTYSHWVQIIFDPPSGSLCGMSMFFPCQILHSRLCAVNYPCIIPLWFYNESFVTATVSTIPFIGAQLHVWAIILITVVCCISAPETGWCPCSGFASSSWRSFCSRATSSHCHEVFTWTVTVLDISKHQNVVSWIHSSSLRWIQQCRSHSRRSQHPYTAACTMGQGT